MVSQLPVWQVSLAETVLKDSSIALFQEQSSLFLFPYQGKQSSSCFRLKDAIDFNGDLSERQKLEMEDTVNAGTWQTYVEQPISSIQCLLSSQIAWRVSKQAV